MLFTYKKKKKNKTQCIDYKRLKHITIASPLIEKRPNFISGNPGFLLPMF